MNLHSEYCIAQDNFFPGCVNYGIILFMFVLLIYYYFMFVLFKSLQDDQAFSVINAARPQKGKPV